MPGFESVPDPDRGDSPVSPSQAPPVFDPDSNEESDDAEETQDEEGHGYEPINQEDDGLEEQEEEVSMADQVAALVRAAQSDPANLSGHTREELDRAEEERRAEEAREKAELWEEAAPREDSIALDDVKVETIKSLMSKISLPHAPSWAKDGQDQEWRKKL